MTMPPPYDSSSTTTTGASSKEETKDEPLELIKLNSVSHVTNTTSLSTEPSSLPVLSSFRRRTIKKQKVSILHTTTCVSL